MRLPISIVPPWFKSRKPRERSTLAIRPRLMMLEEKASPTGMTALASIASIASEYVAFASVDVGPVTPELATEGTTEPFGTPVLEANGSDRIDPIDRAFGDEPDDEADRPQRNRDTREASNRRSTSKEAVRRPATNTAQEDLWLSSLVSVDLSILEDPFGASDEHATEHGPRRRAQVFSAPTIDTDAPTRLASDHGSAPANTTGTASGGSTSGAASSATSSTSTPSQGFGSQRFTSVSDAVATNANVVDVGESPSSQSIDVIDDATVQTPPSEITTASEQLGPDWRARGPNAHVEIDGRLVGPRHEYAKSTREAPAAKDVSVGADVELTRMSDVVGLVARYRDQGSEEMYLAQFSNIQREPRVDLWKRQKGDWMRLAGFRLRDFGHTGATTAGRLELDATDDRLTVWFDGVELGTVRDLAPITAAGDTGVRSRGGSVQAFSRNATAAARQTGAIEIQAGLRSSSRDYAPSAPLSQRDGESDSTDNITADSLQAATTTGSLIASAESLVEGPTIATFVLVNDTGIDATDGVTSDASLTGTVSNLSGNIAGLTVEVDFNQDGQSDATTSTDASGVFTFDGNLLGFGQTTVQARALDAGIPGDWVATTYDRITKQPQVTAFVLVDDTGESDLDGVTTDPNVLVTIENDGPAQGVTIEVDYDGDGQADDSSGSTDLLGSYALDPSVSVGNVAFAVRPVTQDPVTGASLAGSWIWNQYFYHQTDYVIGSFGLLNDTGASATDDVTWDSTLVGALAGAGGSQSGSGPITASGPGDWSDQGNSTGLYWRRIEFDHDEDGQADDLTFTNTVGQFAHIPANLDLGAVTVNARMRHLYGYGDWTPFSFTLEAAPVDVPTVTTLELANDTGASDTDGITFDPTVLGTVTAGDEASGIEIEFDYDGDGAADENALSDETGYFVHTPDLSEYGATTISARGRWFAGDPLLPGVSADGYVYVAWTSLAFTYEIDSARVPVVSELNLLVDDGVSDSDLITSDERITGAVTLEADGVDGLIVQFDHDGVDATIEGTVTTDADGRFVYEPIALAHGSYSIRARASRFDSELLEEVVGPWTTLAFTLELPANAAPSISEMGLSNDTGAADGVTTDASVWGVIVDDLSVDGVVVEFDLDGDGVKDDQRTTDATGRFEFNPTSLPYGSVTVQARAREFDVDRQQDLFGAWASISFTYQEFVVTAPQVVDLDLVDDGMFGSDLVTNDPTVKGALTGGADGVARKTVEFDWTGDGLVDGSTQTDDAGEFSFLPVGVAAGTVTVQARGREWDPTAAQFVHSAWSSLTFEYIGASNQAPGISAFGLAADTGVSPADGVTSNPKVEGIVANDGPVENLVVEFDWDNDGQSDSSSVTDSEGRFSHVPIDLDYGPVLVQSRAREWDANAGDFLIGAWTQLSFTYEQADSPPIVTELALADDTGSSATDGVTTDATLVGRIVDVGDNIQGIEIEFDHNGDGVIDGITETDATGGFLYEPAGLGYGSKTIRARAKEWSVDAGQFIFSPWVSVAFNRVQPAVPPAILSFELVSDTGSSSSDLVTSNANVVVSIDGGFMFQYFGELDIDGDGEPDEETTTSMMPTLWFDPTLDYGEVTLGVRTRETSPDGAYVYSPWTTLTFTYLPTDAAPTIVSFGLSNDTGASNDDAITTDPTLTGTIATVSGSAYGRTIAFDLDGDLIADDSVTTDSAGTFTFVPQNLPFDLHSVQTWVDLGAPAPGTMDFYYTDGSTGVRLTDPDASVTTTFEYVPPPTAPTIDSLGLDNDTGTSATDLWTTDSTITGTLTHESEVGAGLLVEVDLDGDGQFEGQAVTSAAGVFTYLPAVLAVGPALLDVRARGVGADGSHAWSGWTSLAFTYADADTAPFMDTFGLANDTGTPDDSITTDPTLAGTIASPSDSVAGLTVEIDLTGDAIPDHTTQTDEAGAFLFVPTGLANGSHSVQGRVVFVTSTGAEIRSDWVADTIELLEPTDPPIVEEFVLVSDTGTSTSDLITIDPKVTGWISSGGVATQSLTVELDIDADGSADDQTTTDALGAYSFDPTLDFGQVTLQVRARVIGADNADVWSDWSSITFEYEDPQGPLSIGPLTLQNDTGADGSDLVTFDPTLVGSLATGAVGYAGVAIEIDLDGDGLVETEVTTDSAGAFTHLPGALAYGEWTIAARSRIDDGQGGFLYSEWASLTFVLEVDPAVVPNVANLELTNDTGVSATDRITWDARLSGTVTVASGSVDGLTVEFDHDGDESTIEGTAKTDSLGVFDYEPRNLPFGQQTVRGRARRADPSRPGEIFGPWTSIVVTYELPDIDQFDILTDTENAADRETSDPTVWGTVADGGHIDDLTIEFDLDGDGSTDGVAHTDKDGRFEYTPELAFGQITVDARVTAWDESTQSTLTTAWTSTSFDYVAPLIAAPTVTGLALANDNGVSATDLLTTDPRVTGSLTGGAFGVMFKAIEFDYDGDGEADGFELSDAVGDFTHRLLQIDAGPVSVAVRAQEWDPNREQTVFGDWTSFAFTYAATFNQPALVQTLQLASDTGASAVDGITADPTIQGTVTDAESLLGLPIEIDWDEDGVVDEHAYADALGAFTRRPASIDYGQVTVNVRAREWDETAGAYLYADWTTLSFTYLEHTDSPPFLTALSLDVDTGSSQTDGVTTDPTLVGQVSDDLVSAGVVVEFDHDGDGLFDGTATTDALSAFRYSPRSLAAGPVVLHARTRELRSDGLRFIHGAWQQVSFDYVKPVSAPVVASLDIVEDTGTRADDRQTTNASVTGTIMQDFVPAAGLLVQLDQDGDGLSDVEATTDGAGVFTLAPTAPAFGPFTLAVRARATSGDGADVWGVWSTLSFELEDPDAPPIVQALRLVNDTGADPNDRRTDDATITGAIATAGVFAGVDIEFDVDGDQIVDGTAVTDADGVFVYPPTGLAYGEHEIHARAVRTIVGGTQVAGSWAAITFLFTDSPNPIDEWDALADLNAALDTAVGAYESALTGAQSTFDAQQAAAASTLDDTSATAAAAQEASESAAADAYETTLDAARASYESAVADALAALSAAGGNPDLIIDDLFLWPNAPSLDGFPTPDLGDQALPSHLQRPTLDGPSFDYESDPTYQADVADANTAYEATRESALTTYNQARVSASAAIAQARIDAAAAHAAVTVDTAPNPIDIESAQQQQDDAVAAANSLFEQAFDDAQSQFWSEWADAHTASEQQLDAAQDEYAGEMNRISDLVQILIDNGVNSAEANRRYRRPRAEAETKLSKVRADNVYEQRLAQADADQRRGIAINDAAIARVVALQDAERTYRLTWSEHEEWRRTINDDAADTAHEAHAVIEETLERAISAAIRQTSQTNADALRDFEFAIATAERDRAAAHALAKQEAFDRWAGQGDAWSVFQADLAAYEHDLAVATANAEHTRTNATITAEHARQHADAAAAELRKNASADTYKERRIADVQVDEAVATEAAWRALRDSRIEAKHSHATTVSQSVYDLRASYVARIRQDTRVQAQIARDYSYSYAGPYGEWQHGLRDKRDFFRIYFAAADEAERKRHAASQELGKDKVSMAADGRRTAAEADRDFSVEAHRIEALWADDINAARADNVATRAGIDETYAIATINADSAHDASALLAAKTEAQSVASADHGFAVTTANARLALDQNSALTRKNYVQAEMAAYVSATTAWALSASSFWADYQVDLATVAQTEEVAIANAIHAHANAVALAESGYSLSLATARLDLGVALADAEWARDDGRVNADSAKDISRANDARQHTESLADADQALRKDQAAADKEFADALSNSNFVRRNADIDVDVDYWNDYVNFYSDPNNSASSEERAEGRQNAADDRNKAEADARVEWVASTQEAALRYAQSTHDEFELRAAAYFDADATWRTAYADGELTFATAEANADFAYQSSLALPTTTLNTATIAAESTRATTVGAASIAAQHGDALAENSLQRSVWSAHAIDLNAAAAVTPLDVYYARYATEMNAWVQSRADASDAYHLAVETAEVGYSNSLATAHAAHATATSSAAAVFDAALAPAVRDRASAEATAERNRLVAEGDALVDAGLNGQLDRTDFLFATAQTDNDFVTAAAAAWRDRIYAFANGVSNSDAHEAETQALDEANADRVRANGDAYVTLVEAAAQIDVTGANAVGAADVQYAQALLDAQLAYVAIATPASATYAAAILDAERDLRESLADAPTPRATALALAEQTYFTALAAADVALAGARADGEVDFHLATLADRSIDSGAAGQPQVARVLELQQAWVSALRSDYVASESAAADANHREAERAARAAFSSSSSIAAVAFEYSAASADRTLALTQDVAAGAFDDQSALLERQHGLDVAEAAAAYSSAIAEATGTERVAMARAGRDYDVALAQGANASEASIARGAAFSKATEAKWDEFANAQYDWAIAAAGAERAYLDGQILANWDQTIAVANAAEAAMITYSNAERSLADSVATARAALWSAEVDAAVAWEVQTETSEYDFVAAQYAQAALVAQNPTEVLGDTAIVDQLALFEDDGTPGDAITTNPALAGTIANDGTVAWLTVEFDHDGDALADGVAVTDADGSFLYQPFGLALGSVSIQARVVETAGAATQSGAWITILFTLQNDASDPAVDSLALATDDGASATDLRTGDPTVIGSLTGTTPGGATVEFDHDDDGVVDGQVVADANGVFTYTPIGLSEGDVTLAARAAGGAWRRLAFRYASDPDLDEMSWIERQADLSANLSTWINSSRPTALAHMTAAAATRETYVDATSAAYLTAVTGVHLAEETYAVQAANSQRQLAVDAANANKTMLLVYSAAQENYLVRIATTERDASLSNGPFEGQSGQYQAEKHAATRSFSLAVTTATVTRAQSLDAAFDAAVTADGNAWTTRTATIATALDGLADAESTAKRTRIVDLAALDLAEVTRRQDGYVAAVDAISSTDAYATYESSLADAQRTLASALATATQTKLGADATAANLAEATLSDAAVDALLSQADAQRQWTLDLFDAGGDQLLAQAQATREAALSAHFAPALLSTPERTRREAHASVFGPGFGKAGANRGGTHWNLWGGGGDGISQKPWDLQFGAPSNFFRSYTVTGQPLFVYGFVVAYDVQPGLYDFTHEFKSFVRAPNLARHAELRTLDAALAEHPGPVEFAGAGPVQQFDPSTIVDAAMTRVVEHQHAEPATDDQRVFNVQTDPLFQIVAPDQFLVGDGGGGATTQPDIGARVNQLASDLITDPWNLLNFAKGVANGFVFDGFGGTIEFVKNDIPAMARAVPGVVGGVVAHQWELTKWTVWQIFQDPFLSAKFFGRGVVDFVQTTARTTADLKIKTYGLTTEAANTVQSLWKLDAQSWAHLLRGETDELDGKVPDALLLAIDLSYDAIADLLNEIDDEDFASLAGRVVGMVTYEVAEGVALAGATAGAGVAVKALKAERLILKLKKIPGLKNSDVVRNAVDKISFRLGNVVGTRMCFVAGTKVHTNRGLADIEDIRPGDLVLSRPQAGTGFASTEFKPVLQTFVTHPDTLYHLTIRTPDGREERLSTTGPHPFFVIDRHEFVMAQDLQVGDELSLASGISTLVAISIEDASDGASFTTYNFEVADHHTYFVGKLGVWVHNASDLVCERLAAKFERKVASGVSENDAFQEIEDLLDYMVERGKLTPEEAATHWEHSLETVRARGTHIISRKFEAYEMGAQLGRKHVEEVLGLKEAGWVNPFEHHGAFGKGLDDVMQDTAGNLWIVEYKGGTGHLAKRQMGRDWVREKIDDLIRVESPWGKTLDDALDSGTLRGIAVSTPWEDGVRAGATRVIMGPTRY